MIWLLSDPHGGENMQGLLQYLETAKEEDLLILLGDVGLKFADTEENRKFDELLLSTDKNIAFLDGNHENFAYVNSFPVEEWRGGKVHRPTDRLVHLMRGNVYTIEDKTFFVFGGCKSSARWKEMGLWYPGEEPEPGEIELAYENLSAHNYNVDYILTHKYEESPPKGTVCQELRELILWLEANVQYKHWHCGHWHKNYRMDNTHTVVFDPPTILK